MYDSLKNSIRSAVYTNGTGDITGQSLQDLLVQIVDALNGAAQYKGVAIPSTNPGSPAGRTFYLATQSGNYASFGVTLDGKKLCVLIWDGSSWSKTELSVPTTSELTAVSNAVTALAAKVSEGSVFAGIATPATNPGTPTGKVTYISTTSGTYTNFDGNAHSVAEGDMMVISYSSGTWTFSTLRIFDKKFSDEDNQMKFDRATTPVGVVEYNGQMLSGGGWTSSNSFMLLRVIPGQKIYMKDTANITRSYLTDFSGQPASGYTFSQSSDSTYQYDMAKTFDDTVPSDAKYLYIVVANQYGELPDTITVDGYDIKKSVAEHIVTAEAGIQDALDKSDDNIHDIASIRQHYWDLCNNYGWSSERVTTALNHDVDDKVYIRQLNENDTAWSFVADNYFNSGLKVAKCVCTAAGNASVNTARLTLPFSTTMLAKLQAGGKYIKVFVELYSEWGYICSLYRASTVIENLSNYSWRNGRKVVEFGAFPAADIATNDSSRYISVLVGQYPGHDLYIGRIHFFVVDSISDTVEAPAAYAAVNTNEVEYVLSFENGENADIIKANDEVKCFRYFKESYKDSGRLNIAFFSDIHGDSVNYERYKQFCEYYAAWIGLKLHGGDSVSSNSTNDFTYWDDPTILNVIGNHDALDGNNENTLTAGDCYTKYIAPFVASWDVTYTAGVCYYYKDIAASNIRLIVLDIIHLDETQKTWFASVLDSARLAGISVIVCEHYPISTDMTYLRESAWCTADKTSSIGIAAELRISVRDFVTAGGKFVCWLAGHTHYDILAIDETYGKQLCVSIGTAQKANSADRDNRRATGTQSQDLFDIISVDETNGLLTLFRVGVQEDKYLRVKNPLCIDYKNLKLY